MSFRNLKIFMQVYETKSISKAAILLYITQPAVSRAIKDIEKEYDCILFERTNRTLIPTNSADILYTNLLPIIENYDNLKDTLQKESLSSTFQIGSNSTIAKYYLPTIIKNYTSQYPNIQIHVIVENEITLQTKLKKHEIDIAIVENNMQSKDLISIYLTQSPLSIITSTNYNIPSTCTIEELATYPLLLRESGSAQRNYINAIFEAHNLTITPVWQSSTTDVLIQAAKQGLGVAIVPTIFTKNKKNLKHISLINEKLVRNCYLVYHKDKYISDSLQNFIDVLQQKVR